MDEILSQLHTMLRGMWRHRWWGLALAWAVGLLGCAIVFLLPDRYEASARIYVDTQSLLKPLMSGLAVQPNVEQQVTMLSRTLISRPNVEKLIRMADLDLKSANKAEQERLIDDVTKTMSIKSTGRDNLYTLSFRDTSPDKARRVVQSMVSIFVESSLGDNRKDADTAKRFLNDQIKQYEAKLEEAEGRLKQFKLRNIELQAGESGTDGVARLAQVSAQLQEAKLALREAENARDTARKQYDAEKAASTSAGGGPNDTIRSILQESAINVSTPEIDSRIDAQKRNLDGLLQRFTDSHPDVIGARRLIRELEEQKKKEVAELRKAALAMPPPVAVGGGTGSAAPNLALQELGRMLAAAEVQVASLTARVAEFSARAARARELMKVAPQVEAEFTQLNRDYAIHKKNYDDLVSRRESASLSGDLESASGIADFRLIDPPRASSQPAAPNRLLLLPGVFVVALGVGVGVCFLIDQVRPVIHDPRTLRNVLGIPLLGIVTLVADDAEKRRRWVASQRFALGAAALISFFVVCIGVTYYLTVRAAAT